jgi:hypothetical protein
MKTPLIIGLLALGTSAFLLARRRFLTGQKVALAFSAVGNYLSDPRLRPGHIFMMAREYFHRTPRSSRTLGHCCSGLTKIEAEDLLDWLEANGHGPAQVSYQESAGFTVRYR